MPRFPAFNRRKSAADNLDNAPAAGPSFRVLDRAELAGAAGSRNSDASLNQRLAIKQSQSMPGHLSAADAEEDNLFANLNVNRGSGSSNTTQTNSTDNSSRHSNVSTTPSSADLTAQQQQQQQQQQQEDWRNQNKKLYGDVPVPPIPKSNSASSFLKSAGRTFSFGTQRKPLPVSPLSDATPPHTPVEAENGRNRALTASTVTTATPPKLEEEFNLDLGGDFSKMLGMDKRASVATVRDDGTGRPALAARALTGNRLNQPVPAQPEDGNAKDGSSPYLWGNQRSTDRLLYSNSPLGASTNENAPPVPRHGTFNNRPQTAMDATGSTSGPSDSRPPLPASASESGLKRTTAVFGRRRSTIDYAAEPEDEDATLKDSLLTVNRFLAGATSSSATASSSSPARLRLTDDKSSLGYKQVPADYTSPVFSSSPASPDEDLFTANRSIAQSTRISERFVSNKINSPPQNKVMTPAQFERYRKDKEHEDRSKAASGVKAEASDAEEEDTYDDDEDEAEKARQAAKQRRKQEAHMTVYRQQMMKVTGEAASGTPVRGSFALSASTSNLPALGAAGAAGAASGNSPQAGSEADEDEEVPLAILAAHGFPNKNRPPTRLSSMMSNPNLRAAAAPSYHRPNSSMGDAAAAGVPPAASAAAGGRLPPFARNLPQDPYGLVNTNTREAFNLSGGAPASPHVPPGGLVGVIATEERSRAMRRGSPALDAVNKPMPAMGAMGPVDPMGGIPPHMMYPGMGQPPMLTPGDQAQIHMSQQMQQFMQMQMQFMQMMAANGGAMPAGANPMGMGMGPGMGMAGPDMTRSSFAENASTMDGPYGGGGMRTMSMVQPSSASWIQQPNFAPSIRVQGVNGYTASIAPSERSNVGLPGRYRPVSQTPNGVQQQPQQPQQQSNLRKSANTPEALGTPADGANGANRNSNTSSVSPSEGNTANSRGPSPTGWDYARKHKSQSPLSNVQTKPTADDDEDDEEGWAAMKAKRDKKRSMWKSKKSLPAEIGAIIS